MADATKERLSGRTTPARTAVSLQTRIVRHSKGSDVLQTLAVDTGISIAIQAAVRPKSAQSERSGITSEKSSACEEMAHFR